MFLFSLHQADGGDCYTDQADAGRDQIDDAHAVEEGFILSCDVAGDVLSQLAAHAAVKECGGEADSGYHAEVSCKCVDAAADSELVTADGGHN